MGILGKSLGSYEDTSDIRSPFEKEIDRLWPAVAANGGVDDTMLPFNIFADVRAVMSVALNLMTGKSLYYVRFYNGATTEISRDEYRLIFECLQIYPTKVGCKMDGIVAVLHLLNKEDKEALDKQTFTSDSSIQEVYAFLDGGAPALEAIRHAQVCQGKVAALRNRIEALRSLKRGGVKGLDQRIADLQAELAGLEV